MDQPIKEDSSDNLYSYNVTTNFLDFTTYGDESSLFAQQKALTWKSRLFSLGSFFVSSAVFSLNLTWDMTCFLAVYCVFARRKVLSFVDFLDLSKDRAVRFLMWRRGILFRPATHGGFLALGALAILAGSIFSNNQIAAQDLTSSENLVSTPNTPETIVPLGRPRSEIVNYTVKDGDTLSVIAEKFSVSSDSIKWASSKGDDAINPGDKLEIPPVTGIVYKVAPGDTLASVATKYSADQQTIADYPFNYIDATLTLKPGQMLVVPNGSIPQPKPVKKAQPAFAPASVIHGSGALTWPVVGCGISQYFSWFHEGIDIACPMGTPVYAADSGRVIVSKKLSYDFGWHIVIDHGNGMTTLYAHNSALYVNVGDNVGRGQLIAAVGSTGRSTGSHVMFVVNQAGVSVNPLSLLP